MSQPHDADGQHSVSPVKSHRQIPKALKMTLGGSGNAGQNGSGILSYLLFSKGFCKALIDLGYSDAMQRADEIRGFFSDHFEEEK